MKAMRKIPKGHRPRAGRGLAQELTAIAKALRGEGVPAVIVDDGGPSYRSSLSHTDRNWAKVYAQSGEFQGGV